jgi:hypothetical protein
MVHFSYYSFPHGQLHKLHALYEPKLNILKAVIPSQALFGKWRIQVDGRGLKGILGNFDL